MCCDDGCASGADEGLGGADNPNVPDVDLRSDDGESDVGVGGAADNSNAPFSSGIFGNFPGANINSIGTMSQLQLAPFSDSFSQIAKSITLTSSLQQSVGSIMANQIAPVTQQVSLAAQTVTSLIDKGVFSAIQNSLGVIVETSWPGFDRMTSGINAAFERIAGNIAYTEKLASSRWPLYLVDNESLIEEIRGLPDMSDTALGQEVEGIALTYLDDKWIEETRQRWAAAEMLSEGERKRLDRSLDYHLAGDYDACVAMLMCMLEGLILKFHAGTSSLSAEEREVFNWLAQQYGVDELPEGGRRSSRGFFAKDHVIIMILNADNGWFTWQAAGSYITEVVLTNSFDEDVAASNPLRNKICHGQQTDYGTKVHSLKSILAIDIVLRLGSASEAIRADA